ncbi:tetratricopeptide repeat protein [Archangium lipolyticum]|uniref:tetratricopeptide repeat protein n=1 Tax=Archangium lipolyticum TaxID=2970465 RepID=UPI00214A64D5|nr:tetratricopeptide repeat protein [Archangium lipolyticum]
MRLFLVLLAALLLAPPQARAQRGAARGNPKELIKQAERLYDQKKYLEAAEVLEKAHEASPNPDPRLLYNIARAYDQGGKEREAIQYYEQYKAKGTDLTLIKRADLFIDRLKLQLQKEEARAAASASERKRLQEEAASARRRADEERQAARRADETNKLRLKEAYEDALAARKRMQVTSFALGGVALVGLGAGTVFGLQARSARNDFDKATELDPKLAAKTATRTNALLADIGFGVGVASAIAAVLLYPKEPLPPPGKPRVTLAPSGAGAGMEVSF